MTETGLYFLPHRAFAAFAAIWERLRGLRAAALCKRKIIFLTLFCAGLQYFQDGQTSRNHEDSTDGRARERETAAARSPKSEGNGDPQ